MTHATVPIDQGITWKLLACLDCTEQPFQLWKRQNGEWRLQQFLVRFPEALKATKEKGCL